ncbi:MAG: CHAT domain-containing protein [Prosthecobacter sp.]
MDHIDDGTFSTLTKNAPLVSMGRMLFRFFSRTASPGWVSCLALLVAASLALAPQTAHAQLVGPFSSDIFARQMQAITDEGYAAEGTGDNLKALQIYREGAAHATGWCGADHAWTAMMEFYAARCLGHMNDEKAGLQLTTHALPILRHTYGDKETTQLQFLHAYFQSATGQAAEGIPAMEQVLKAFEEQQMPPQGQQEPLARMVQIYHGYRFWKQTIATAPKAIALMEAAYGKDSLWVLFLKKQMADAYYHDYQTPEARALYEEVVPKLKALRVEDKALLGSIYHCMLGVYHFNTEKPALDAVRREAAAYVEEALQTGPAAPWQSELLWHLALLQTCDGNLVKGRALHQQALDVAKALGHERLMLRPMNGLVFCNYQEGRSVEGIAGSIELIQMAERLGGEEQFVAAVECDLASIYGEMKDFAKALPHARRSLELWRQQVGSDSHELLKPLKQAGELEYHTGNAIVAVKLLTEGAALAEKHFPNKPAESLDLMDSLAYVLRKNGHTVAAREQLDRILPMAVKLLGEEHDSLAQLHANRSFCYRDEGRYEEACVAAEKALKIKERTTKGRWDGMADDFRNLLAFCHWNAGHMERAQELARQGIPTMLGRFHHQLEFTSENQRRALVVNLGVVDLPANFGMAEEVARITLNLKGMVTEGLMRDLRAASQSPDAKVQEALKAQKAARDELRQAASASATTPEQSATATARIRAGQDRLESTELALFSQLKRGKHELVEPAAIAAALPPDAALLDWFHYRWHPKEQSSHVAYGLVVYRAGRKPAFHHLGTVPQVDGSVMRFMLSLTYDSPALNAAVAKDEKQKPKQGTKSNSRSFTQMAAQELHDGLLGPAARDLEGVKTLYYCPDDALHLLPFAILPDEEGRLLGERYSLRRLASARDVLSRPSTLEKAATVDVFADPTFGMPKTDAKEEAGEEKQAPSSLLRPLPGARQEARALEKMAQAAGLKCKVMQGEEATEPALRARRSPGILHLGTHGYYRSGPQEDPVEQQAYSGLNFSVVSRNDQPLERSGVALARESAGASGTGAKASPLANDGRLSASEAAELDLEKTWLVSIAACTSATGTLRSGDGLASIQNGFLVAGARHVLAPLWPVNDKQTAEFMKDFYQEIFTGKSAPEALQATQMKRFRMSEKDTGYQRATLAYGAWVIVSRER